MLGVMALRLFIYTFVVVMPAVRAQDCTQSAAKSSQNIILTTCYSIEPAQTFKAAKAGCQAKNGNLISDLNIGHNFIKTMLLERKVDQAWIGGQEEALSAWTFSTGETTATFENWDVGQPSTKGKCAMLSPSEWKWRAKPCSASLPYICQRVSATCKSKGEFVFGNKCFSVRQEPVSWFQAQANCKQLSGTLTDLAAITQNNLMNAIKSQVSGQMVNGFWFGLRKSVWRWTTSGDEITSSNWESSSPVDGDGECLLLKKFVPNTQPKFLWVNANCADSNSFICSWVMTSMATTKRPITPNNNPRAFVSGTTTGFVSSPTPSRTPTGSPLTMVTPNRLLNSNTNRSRTTTESFLTTTTPNRLQSFLTTITPNRLDFVTKSTRSLTPSTPPPTFTTPRFTTPKSDGFGTPQPLLTPAFTTPKFVPKDLETPCHCETILVSEGSALHMSSRGMYTLDGCIHNGKPVYKNTKRDIFIYYSQDDYWTFGLGLDQGLKLIRANDSEAVAPQNVTGTWEQLSDLADNSSFVNQPSLKVQCACTPPPCEKFVIDSSSEICQIDGEFTQIGQLNDKPFYKNNDQNLFFYFDKSTACSYWAVSSQMLSKPIMISHDSADSPDVIKATWKIHTGTWQTNSGIKIKCTKSVT